MEIIGLKKSSFKPKDSDQEIKGVTLYLTEERDGVEGLAADHVFVSDKKLGPYLPAVGDEVRIFYNRWGKVDEIQVKELR